MGDEQKNKSTSDIINQHPVLKKWAKRSGIGLLFSALFSFALKFMDEVNFDEIMKWIQQLISLTLSIPKVIVFPLVIVILVFICIYKKMSEKWKFKQKFLKDTKDMIEKDSTISNISVHEDKKSGSISINIQRDKKINLNTKESSNIVNFQHYNSEVK